MPDAVGNGDLKLWIMFNCPARNHCSLCIGIAFLPCMMRTGSVPTLLALTSPLSIPHTYPIGLRILIKAQDDKTLQLFSPFEALSWPLWLSLAGTCVFVGATIWFCDVAVKSLQRDLLPRRKRALKVALPVSRSKPPAPTAAAAAPAAAAAGGNSGGGDVASIPCELAGAASAGALGGSESAGVAQQQQAQEQQQGPQEPLQRHVGEASVLLVAPVVGETPDKGQHGGAVNGSAGSRQGSKEGSEEAVEAAGGKERGEEESSGNFLLRSLGVRKGEEGEVLKLLGEWGLAFKVWVCMPGLGCEPGVGVELGIRYDQT